MNRTFQVGDEVVIRDWDDMAAEYGGNSRGDILPPRTSARFMPAMRNLCGRTARITDMGDGGRVYLEFDDPPPRNWTYCTYMLCHAVEPPSYSEDDWEDLLDGNPSKI